MPNFREAVTQKVKDVACWIADNGDRQEEIWGEATKDNPFTTFGQGSALFSPYPLSRLLCGDADKDPPPQFGPELPPFFGGQCEEEYIIEGKMQNYRANGNPDGGIFSFFARIYGPISFIGFRERGASGTVSYYADGFDELGNPDTKEIVRTGRPQERVEIVEGPTLRRDDGLPDECGDIPPEGGQPTIPDDVCYDRPDGTNTCDPIRITPRTPKRRPDGNIELPFDFDFGGGDDPINIGINLGNGDVNFGNETPPAPSSPCCPPVSPDSPKPPETPEDPPEPENERRFVGLIVTATRIPANVKATEVNGGSGLSLYIPRISTISIGIEIGGSRAWTDDFAVRKRKQYFPVPDSSIGYTWAVFDESGVTTEVTPVYIDVEE